MEWKMHSKLEILNKKIWIRKSMIEKNRFIDGIRKNWIYKKKLKKAISYYTNKLIQKSFSSLY
jgi:hypothetical protein